VHVNHKLAGFIIFHNIVQFQKISLTAPWKVIRGWWSQTAVFSGKYEAKLEFPEEWGGKI